MGTKPSNSFQQDRPESGGADRDDIREESGLLDQAKQEFAQSQSKKRSSGEGNQKPAAKQAAKRGKNKSR